MISFNNELATLTLINGDEPSEQITFTSPMRDLELKGTNAVQNLGGVQTYLTRYLYIQLLNIVESDSFDAVSGSDSNKETNVKKNVYANDKLISEAQRKRLNAIANGIDLTVVKDIIAGHGFNSSKDITMSKYNLICDEIEGLKNKSLGA